MNKFIRILMFIFLMSLPSYAFASPVYLTFKGTVGSIGGQSSLMKDAGIKVGDILKYVGTIDEARAGTITGPWGTTVRGNSVFSSAEGMLNGYVVPETNWFETRTGLDTNTFYAQTGSDKSLIEINSWTVPFSDLQVGSQVSKFSEASYDRNGRWGRLNLKDITVTRISNTAPTPLPGALLLMGGGLGLVALIRRKFTKNS